MHRRRILLRRWRGWWASILVQRHDKLAFSAAVVWYPVYFVFRVTPTQLE